MKRTAPETRAAGWDHPLTARYYEAFCRRHSRYRVANAELTANAALAPGHRVLDVAAGTGRTAEAALSYVGPRGRIVCVEPATAMREAGRVRLADPRVAWTASCEDQDTGFDRVLCGAAVWQLGPLADGLGDLARRVGPGGALCFNLPSLYLGDPDEPGGGRDPLLLELPALLARNRRSAAPPGAPLPRPGAIDGLLADLGLRPVRWRFRVRLTQAALRDWLKIPPLTDHLLGGLEPAARGALIDDAFRRADPASWRWEGWAGWTAWRSRTAG